MNKEHLVDELDDNHQGNFNYNTSSHRRTTAKTLRRTTRDHAEPQEDSAPDHAGPRGATLSAGPRGGGLLR